MFSHGQFYVTLSNSVSRSTTRILAKPKKKLDPTGKSTNNIVYKDILNWWLMEGILKPFYQSSCEYVFCPTSMLTIYIFVCTWKSYLMCSIALVSALDEGFQQFCKHGAWRQGKMENNYVNDNHVQWRECTSDANNYVCRKILSFWLLS
jgi:hypothetical protein